jgi:tetratricopeptide (TPR) repeat protein
MMERKNQSGIFLITILAFAALVLVFLIGREFIFRSHPSGPETAEDFLTSPEKQLSVDVFLQTPETPSPAHLSTESNNLFVRQLNDDGLVLYTEAKYEEAAELFRQALDQNPMDPVLLQNLAHAKASFAWQLIERGQNHDALYNFQEAVALNEEEPTIYMGMGLVYHRLKDEIRAIEMLKTAISKKAEYGQPYQLLGEIYYLRDEMDLAVGYLEKASELNPNNQDLKQRLKKAKRERKTQGDFQRQATLHFTVKFEGREEQEAAREITELLNEAYWEIGEAFSSYPQIPITVILYSNRQFRDVTLTPSWSQGLFDGKIRLPIEGFRKDRELVKKIVNHEYTHALIFELCKTQIPTWLNEGIALNLEGTDPDRWDYILSSWIQQEQNLIPLIDLHSSFMNFSNNMAALAYAESHSATRYLIDRYGMYPIKELLLNLASEPNFEIAFQNQFLLSYSEFERQWRRQTENQFS